MPRLRPTNVLTVNKPIRNITALQATACREYTPVLAVQVRADQVGIIRHELPPPFEELVIFSDFFFVDLDSNTDARRDAPIRSMGNWNRVHDYVIRHYMRRLLVAVDDIRECQQ